MWLTDGYGVGKVIYSICVRGCEWGLLDVVLCYLQIYYYYFNCVYVVGCANAVVLVMRFYNHMEHGSYDSGY